MAYIGNTNTTQAFTPQVDYFSGNGSTTAFTLSRPVASVAQVQAVIENVPQAPGSAYTISGNTITFTSAPPSGTNNIYVYYTSPITQVIAPGQDTVGTLQIQNGAVIPADLSTGGPYWDTSGNVGIGTSSPTTKLEINTAAAYSGVRLKGTSSALSGFEMALSGSGVNAYLWNYENGAMLFATNNTERARIDSSGNLLVGTTSSSGAGASSGLQVNNFNGAATNGLYMSDTRTSAGNDNAIIFGRGATYVGKIETTLTATNYLSASDYRLKNVTGGLTGYKERVMSLQPKQGTWIVDGSEFRGFLAHDFASPYPKSVSGEKDAVDANGKPMMQGIQASSSEVMADLVALIQEQQALITTLTERITALEAK